VLSDEIFAPGWSRVLRSATKCGVSECDRESSIMRRPWPTGGLLRRGKTIINCGIGYFYNK